MTDPELRDATGRHPLLDRLSRPRSLMVVAGAVVLAGVAAATFAFGRGEHPAARGGGPEMQLALVAPVEPTVQPGERMEVGVLTDGFDGKMPAAPPDAMDPEGNPYLDQPAYVETGWGSDTSVRRDAPPPSYEQPLPPPPSEPLTEYRNDPRRFGFDQPQPDYRAQREARRAALDARMQDERRTPRRVYSSGGPQADPDSEFY